MICLAMYTASSYEIVKFESDVEIPSNTAMRTGKEAVFILIGQRYSIR